MRPRDREFVARLCADRAGLRIEANRPYLYESALAPLARREGYLSVAELVRAVRDRGDERLVWRLVEAMAPAQTAFFRDARVFEAIADWLKDRAAEGSDEPLRIWSAACASGQEPYSLAMLVEELAPAGLDAEILASDLSERLLEKAQSGLFTQFEAQRGLSARRLVRHFENQGEGFALSRRLRDKVGWRRVNLLDDLGPLGRYDLVVARYVLGDMSPAARERVAGALANAVAPGGRLVLSPGDRISAGASGLQRLPGAPGVYALPRTQAISAAA